MSHPKTICGGEGPCPDYDCQVDVIADVSPQTPESLNSQFSFPFPQIGGTVRPAGQGCRICVHQTYCPALHYFRRYTQREPDDNNGRNCLEFSADPNDVVTAVSAFDQAENSRRACFGILEEANRGSVA